jgi:hypothetical protein
VFVDVTGPVYLSIEVGEQLAWLGCICRTSESPDRMTLVSPIVSLVDRSGRSKQPITSLHRVGPNVTSFEITFASSKYLDDNSAKDGTCWHKLFRNICVADGFPVRTRPGEEHGLEIPFDMMAQLGGAHRATYWGGQLVVKGFETLFVPVKKTDACISWHLVTKTNRRRVSYNSAEELNHGLEHPVHVGDLLDCRHFLGWVPEASQHAGEWSEP